MNPQRMKRQMNSQLGPNMGREMAIQAQSWPEGSRAEPHHKEDLLPRAGGITANPRVLHPERKQENLLLGGHLQATGTRRKKCHFLKTSS